MSQRMFSHGDPPAETRERTVATDLDSLRLRGLSETEFSRECQKAGIIGLELEALLLEMVDGLNVRQISARNRKTWPRVSDVQRDLARAKDKLRSAGFYAEKAAFERTILDGVKNRRDHDERPAGVRGVTPDPSAVGTSGMVGLDDVRQSTASAVQIWMQSRRPVLVPAAP